jgi:hypothetical protein
VMVAGRMIALPFRGRSPDRKAGGGLPAEAALGGGDAAFGRADVGAVAQQVGGDACGGVTVWSWLRRTGLQGFQKRFCRLPQKRCRREYVVLKAASQRWRRGLGDVTDAFGRAGGKAGCQFGRWGLI